MSSVGELTTIVQSSRRIVLGALLSPYTTAFKEYAMAHRTSRLGQETVITKAALFDILRSGAYHRAAKQGSLEMSLTASSNRNASFAKQGSGSKDTLEADFEFIWSEIVLLLATVDDDDDTELNHRRRSKKLRSFYESQSTANVGGAPREGEEDDDEEDRVDEVDAMAMASLAALRQSMMAADANNSGSPDGNADRNASFLGTGGAGGTGVGVGDATLISSKEAIAARLKRAGVENRDAIPVKDLLVRFCVASSPAPAISTEQCEAILRILNATDKTEADAITRFEFLMLLKNHTDDVEIQRIDLEELTLYLFPDERVELGCLRQLVRCCMLPSNHHSFAAAYAAERLIDWASAKELLFYVPFLVLYLGIVLSGKFVTPRTYYGYGAVAYTHNVVESSFSSCTYDTKNLSDCSSSWTTTVNALTSRVDVISFLMTVLFPTLWPSTGIAGDTILANDLRLVGALKIRNMRIAGEIDETTSLAYFGRPNVTFVPAGSRGSASKTQHPSLNDVSSYADAVVPGFDGRFFRTCVELNASGSILGNIATIPCYGHALVIPFNTTLAQVQRIGRALLEQEWIDSETRAVVIEYIAFHPASTMFLGTQILVEFHSGGGLSTVIDVTPYSFFSFSSTQPALSGLYILFFVLLFFNCARYIVWNVVLPLLTADELHPFVMTRWHALDTANYSMFLASAVSRLLWMAIGTPADPMWLIDFYPDGYESAQLYFNVVVVIDSFNILLSVMGLLRFSKFVPAISMVMNALDRSAGDAISLLLIIIGTFLSLVICAATAFGDSVLGYQTVLWAAETLGQAFIGNYDYTPLHPAHPTFAFVFFFVFQLVISIILLQMFIAVFTDAFSKEMAEAFDRNTSSTILDNASQHPIIRVSVWGMLVGGYPVQVARCLLHRMLRWITNLRNGNTCGVVDMVIDYLNYDTTLAENFGVLFGTNEALLSTSGTSMSSGDFAAALYWDDLRATRISAAKRLLALLDAIPLPHVQVEVVSSAAARRRAGQSNSATNIFDYICDQVGHDYPLVMAYFILLPQTLFSTPGEYLLDSCMGNFVKWRSSARRISLKADEDALLEVRLRAVVDERQGLMNLNGAGGGIGSGGSCIRRMGSKKGSHLHRRKKGDPASEFLATLDSFHRRLLLAILACFPEVMLDRDMMLRPEEEKTNDEAGEGEERGGNVDAPAASALGDAIVVEENEAPPNVVTTPNVPAAARMNLAGRASDRNAPATTTIDATHLAAATASSSNNNNNATTAATTTRATKHLPFVRLQEQNFLGGNKNVEAMIFSPFRPHIQYLTRDSFREAVTTCQPLQEALADAAAEYALLLEAKGLLHPDTNGHVLNSPHQANPPHAPGDSGGSTTAADASHSSSLVTIETLLDALKIPESTTILRLEDFRRLVYDEFGQQACSFGFTVREYQRVERYLERRALRKDAADAQQHDHIHMLKVTAGNVLATDVTSDEVESAGGGDLGGAQELPSWFYTLDEEAFSNAWRDAKGVRPSKLVEERVVSLFPVNPLTGKRHINMRLFLKNCQDNIFAHKNVSFSRHFCDSERRRLYSVAWIMFYAPFFALTLFFLFYRSALGDSIWITSGLEASFSDSSVSDVAGVHGWVRKSFNQIWPEPTSGATIHNSANYFVGTVRLRQQRNAPVDCSQQYLDYFGDPETGALRFPAYMQGDATLQQKYTDRVATDYRELYESRKCYVAYDFGQYQSTAPFLPAGNFTDEVHRAFTTFEDAHLTDDANGFASKYPTGGFVFELNTSVAGAYALQGVDELLRNNWIDNATRAVILDVVVLNYNLDLFALGRFGFELAASGDVEPFSVVYVTAGHYPSSALFTALTLVMAALLLVYLGAFALSLYHHTMSRMLVYGDHPIIAVVSSMVTNISLPLDLVIVVLSVLSFTQRYHAAAGSRINLISNGGEWAGDAQEALLTAQNQKQIQGVNAFFVFVRMLYFLGVTHRRFGIVFATIRSGLLDLASVLGLWIFTLCACTLAAVVCFGYGNVYAFNLQRAFFDLFNTASGGNPNYYNYTAARREAAPVFYLVYFTICFFVLFNMVVGVLNGKFSDVKDNLFNDDVVEQVMLQEDDEESDWYHRFGTIQWRLWSSLLVQEAVLLLRYIRLKFRVPLRMQLNNPRTCWHYMSDTWQTLDTGLPADVVKKAVMLLSLAKTVEHEAADSLWGHVKGTMDVGKIVSLIGNKRNKLLSPRGLALASDGVAGSSAAAQQPAADAQGDTANEGKPQQSGSLPDSTAVAPPTLSPSLTPRGMLRSTVAGAKGNEIRVLQTYADRRLPLWSEYLYYQFASEKAHVDRHLMRLTARLLCWRQPKLWMHAMEELHYYSLLRATYTVDLSESRVAQLTRFMPDVEDLDAEAVRAGRSPGYRRGGGGR